VTLGILGVLAMGVLLAVGVWLVMRARADREVAIVRAQLAAELAGTRARLEAELAAERKGAAEKLAVLHDAETKLREAFSALSSDALRKNSQSFLDLARSSLSEFQQTARLDLDGRQRAIADLVEPLKESLSKVDGKLVEVEKNRVGTQSALRSPNVRGQWGELQLRRVVEAAGMLEYCDFDLKESVEADGTRLTPDMIVRLPGGRNVVVDAKVPSSAYLDAMESEDEGIRSGKLRDHARQLRDHVVRLGNKTYWQHFQPTPDLVIMFVPGETLLSVAMQSDPSLLDFSLRRNVMLASPLTLMALLRAVAFGWQQEKIARNAQEISDLGRQLYDRIRIMAEHFEEVARGLTRSVDAYNKAVGSLESRVLVTARRLKEKGIPAPEEMPELEVIDHTARALGAPELVGLFDDEPVDGVIVKD
jgi:DNA recombination protein RmuC